MNKYHLVVMLFALVLTVPTAISYAQTDVPDELPVNFSLSHAVLIVIGIFGGLTTAYLGSRKSKAKDPTYVFDIHKFMDRVIVASIASVAIAITSAAGFVELNIITIFLIYTSTIGTAELALQARSKNSKATT